MKDTVGPSILESAEIIARESISKHVEIVSLDRSNWGVLRELKIRSIMQERLAFEDQSEGFEKYINRSQEEWQDKLDEAKSNTIYLFAKDGDRYIGMVSAVLPAQTDQQGKTALIQHMYVDYRSRGAGIGKKLICEMLHALRRREDIAKAELHVLTSQNPAINLYRNVGFRPIAIHPKSQARDGKMYDDLQMEYSFKKAA